ncbi:hypothetical protein PLESTB_001231000 [Pleodorina starrii]|uniref:V-SNARE coiled-coil homology domain-containing protein n=1 Tax=Pleodorina starrii TaxID=330485 RepID=A0A9W6BT36_9CHLO|nr:hypothetical protein PLESTB_001231000 [Pleodorina starrii]GLC63147.1 hypothetical protein PLESTF_000005000 [Pleodorina starrii]
MSLFSFGSVGGAKKKEPEVKADRLRADALASVERALLCASGVPGTADALAFEPVQGLVAIATSDGKIKLFGRPGCEATVYSAARYPYATRQLQFLQNRGVFVRVSKGGFMESWSVRSGSSADGGVRSLGIVKVRGDKICCVADMARDPYVLLGCASGSLRIAMLVDGAGCPTTQPRQARGFAVAPYRVRPHEMCGEGEVRQLAVQSYGPIHRALVLFTAGMVAVWDLRAVELVSSINPTSADATSAWPALKEAGEATAVCWIGTDRGDFASGHLDGSVVVWTLPGLEPGRAAVAAVLRVHPGAAEPVRMLRCVFGEADGLLVLGGQEVEQPEGLTWLPLPDGDEAEAAQAEEDEEDEEASESDEEPDEEAEEYDAGAGSGGAGGRAAARRRRRRSVTARRAPKRAPYKLPWFGHLIGFSLVVDGGCVTGYEAPSAVLQLVEGGQLVLYYLQDEQPLMVAPYFQQRTAITVTEAPMVPLRRPANCSPNAISLAALRKVAADAGDELPDAAATSAQMGAFACGAPPPVPADATWGLLYCTGYKDGGVCLWDLHGGTTRLLCAAPAGDAAAEVKRGSSGGAVTCLHLVWPTGLLLAGHHKGEVRMYQFSNTERQVDCVTLESIATPGVAHPLHQPAGLQLRLRVRVNSGEITSLAYCQSIRAVAVGDKAGGVALVDTARPVVRWYAMPTQNAVLGAALAPLPLPPARLRVPEVVGEEGAQHHAVVIADSEGGLAALDAARGCFIGRNGELSPKNRSYTLSLELLDEAFNPLWSRRQVGAGCDQAALGGNTSTSTWAAGGAGGGGLKGRGSKQLGGDGDGGEASGRGGAEQQRRRGAAGRGRGWDDAEEEEEDADSDEDDEEDIEGLDADALLAKAAMELDGSRRSPRRNRSGGGGGGRTRPREHSRRSSQAANQLEDASGAPAVLTTCPDPTAHYVLLVTDQYLRVYSASNVVTGERSTVAKRSPAAHQQLVYARPVQGAGGAPGVMALAAAEHGLSVQVYSLPSLELVLETPLSASLSWFWDVPPGHERKLGRLAATSRLGHLLLLGLSNELLTMGLAAGLPRPAPPRSLFDSGAATASLAATTSYEDEHQVTAQGRLMRLRTASQIRQGHQQQQGVTHGSAMDGLVGPTASISSAADVIEGIDSPIARTEGRRVDKLPSAASAVAAAALQAPRAGAERVAGVANVALTRVFNRVQQGLSRAVEETTRGVRQLATNVEKGVANMIDGAGGLAAAGASGEVREGPAGGPRGHSAEWYASLPDLSVVFSRTVPEDEETLERLRRKQRQREQGGQAGGRSGGDDADEDDDDDVSILAITDDEDEDKGGGGGRRDGAAATRPAAPPPPQLAPVLSAGGAAAAARPRAQPTAAASAAAVRSVGGEEASDRNDLFAGARPYTSAGGGGGAAFGTSRAGQAAAGSSGISQPRTRTADEIKRAYGRPTTATSRTNEVRSVMEQNRARLAERGEKLARLDDKAAELEESAAGFAEMARQLAERERNKKWWQL